MCNKPNAWAFSWCFFLSWLPECTRRQAQSFGIVFTLHFRFISKIGHHSCRTQSISRTIIIGSTKICIQHVGDKTTLHDKPSVKKIALQEHIQIFNLINYAYCDVYTKCHFKFQFTTHKLWSPRFLNFLFIITFIYTNSITFLKGGNLLLAYIFKIYT